MRLQVGLVPFLLTRLDWKGGPEGQQGDADVAVLRALSVDVLTQLSADGAHGASVSGRRAARDVGAVRGAASFVPARTEPAVLAAAWRALPVCAQVSALLDASPVWAAYRDQRHDLFLPSGAAGAGSVAGLLTGAGTATFALPAPERLNSSAP